MEEAIAFEKTVLVYLELKGVKVKSEKINETNFKYFSKHYIEEPKLKTVISLFSTICKCKEFLEETITYSRKGLTVGVIKKNDPYFFIAI